MCVSARLEPITFISITYHTPPSVLGTAEQKPRHIIMFENHIKPHALVSVTQSAVASRNKAALKQEKKKKKASWMKCGNHLADTICRARAQ